MVNVIKATGEKEEFNRDKVLNSIRRAGIPKDLQNEVLKHVESKLYENISTSEIYKHITEFLGRSSQPYTKTKYSLKQSIMDLGPTGYPFEDYVSHIFASLGYQTKVRQTLSGKCISHEVDIVAQKGPHKVMAEAKFHNQPGTKTDVQVALYTKARFDDVLEKNNLNQAWLITNTKITTDAISYAICMGMKVTSWDYPEGESLRDLIEKFALIPITALSSLSNSQKQKLLENHIVLCKDICSNPSALDPLRLNQEQLKRVIEESSFACNIKDSSPYENSDANLVRSNLSAM